MFSTVCTLYYLAYLWQSGESSSLGRIQLVYHPVLVPPFEILGLQILELTIFFLYCRVQGKTFICIFAIMVHLVFCSVIKKQSVLNTVSVMSRQPTHIQSIAL